MRFERPEVLVEGVDEQPERQVALELRRAAGEHQHAAGVGALAQLGEQPALADPGLTDDLDGKEAAAAESVERSVQRRSSGPRPTSSAGRSPIPYL